uniref:NADH-ubiquinone oxidoreductase chain 2 n=1 Tax=Alpheus hoplocheles TaxID=2201221 RepID=A0A343XYK1_9EUCA|nr:NADH dehydrogenase subunit 2 [Alpheus hoplocheles]AWK60863.1 NADH dehydrogenase subunit 2 [Alpheus hoplocheles]
MLNSNPSRIVFGLSLTLGIIIAVSSNSWFTSWLGLELNLLSFIPIISSSFNSYSSEAALKYFLIQALGSAMILISATSMSVFLVNPSLLTLGALLLKTGAAPVHFWFPPVMQGVSWPQCIMLMTVQKIAPLFLLSYAIVSLITSATVMICSSASALVGAIGGLKQTLLRKILAYSSINHMAWLMASAFLSSNLLFTYLMVYSIVSSSVVFLLNANQIFHFKQLSSIPNTKMKTLSFMALFSLGGLPPFLGFIPKLLVINLLSSVSELLWIFILLVSSLITLFYYTRILLTTLTLSSPKLKPLLSESTNLSIYILSFINFSPLLFPLMAFYQF